MAIIVLLIIAALALVVHSARRTAPELTDNAIATALGRLVRDGAVTVESGVVQVTGTSLDERRGPIEARTLATVRVTGTIPISRLYAAVREARV